MSVKICSIVQHCTVCALSIIVYHCLSLVLWAPQHEFTRMSDQRTVRALLYVLHVLLLMSHCVRCDVMQWHSLCWLAPCTAVIPSRKQTRALCSRFLVSVTWFTFGLTVHITESNCKTTTRQPEGKSTPPSLTLQHLCGTQTAASIFWSRILVC